MMTPDCYIEELAIRIRMIPALAFAAPHEVCGLFAEVAAQLPTPEADGQIPRWRISTRTVPYRHVEPPF